MNAREGRAGTTRASARRGGRARLALGLLAALLALGGCDMGSEGGPGTVTARITGAPTLGAVVIDITWRGVEGFEGLGSTQVYWARVAGGPDRYRVVLVDPVGGELRLAIEVQDRRGEIPAVTFVSAADVENEALSVAGLKMRLGR